MAPALAIEAGLPAIAPAQAQSAAEPQWRHALSLFGDIKYPAGFKRFDYVNPDAPKGGVVREIAIGTFDNFNLAIAGVKGNFAAGGGADQRSADDAFAGRGRHRIWPARRGGRASGRFQLGDLSAAQGSALA